MKYGSLFSGAGGFELGLNKLGWDCAWMCEIDPYPSSVLKYHWPDIPLYADVQKLKGFAVEPVDVVVGGFPCQDLSVAGNKGGLEAARSGLFYDFVRIVQEMRKVTYGEYPRAVIWENVPGILNKKRDWMSSVYTAWAEIGAVVQEHRVIDAKYFGVPQRRRRVVGVVIFDPRAECGPEILSDTEGLSRYLDAIGESREESAGGFERSLADCGEPPTVINSWYKGAGNTQVETGILIPFDKTQITNPDNRANPQDGDVMHTLSASAKPPHIAFNLYPKPGQGSVLAATEVEQSMALTKINAPDRGVKIVNALTANGIGVTGVDDSQAQAGHLIQDIEYVANQAGTLMSKEGKRISEPERKLIAERIGVRKLTPTECERLMGWPDNHTAYGYNNKKISDTRRYMMCGNGLVAPVATWVGARLERLWS